MSSISKIYRNHILPRTVWLPYWATLTFVLPIKFIAYLFCSGKTPSKSSVLVIESGIKGWDLLEYKELFTSAEEYLGEGRVLKLAIDRDKNYLEQVVAFISKTKPTHYVYDPRTGAQNLIGLWQAFYLAIYFSFKGITSISILTDLSVRLWRAQAFMVTAFEGVIVTFISPRVIKPICPHSRIVGPALMPLSAKTTDYLSKLSASKEINNKPMAIFTGSLYEPRISILNQINSELSKKGEQLHMLGRDLGSTKLPDEEYWKRLINADIVVTTSNQLHDPSHDWTFVLQLVYRYIEATACGALLVAQRVEGVDRYFQAGVHYVDYSTPQEAAEKIYKYLNNPSERTKIANAGKQQAHNLIKAKTYWTSLDISLGNKSLL